MTRKRVRALIPYGSSGPYGTLHVAMEMFAASAGIKLLHVPYRGAAPALTALLSGTVQALASAPGVLKPQVDDGKIRVLANWGAQRVPAFPEPADLQGTRLSRCRVLHLGWIVHAGRRSRAGHEQAAQTPCARPCAARR